ncbi:MAG TPA: glycosyltransferase [Tepidisphaeraceae bacterium]|jgi:glycosyltransferase involved in cell wall biosynthesis|nr:glycosyltransferase [Tepidisphaeraceae bacterium]
MKIAYFASSVYNHKSPAGGHAHMKQFLTLAAEMGNALLLMDGGEHPHPSIHKAPKSRFGKMLALRGMDFLYYRVEFRKPRDIKWVLPPRRTIIGSPKVVWEFNSVPDYALVLGEDQSRVQKHIADLRHYGAGCDLAVCVSQAITDYVKEKIGIQNVMTVPNGSDPHLFVPTAQPVKNVLRRPDRLNVLWMGSAEVKWHHFDLLREAAWMLWDDGNPVVDFHIIGQGMQGLRDLPPNVLYHGSEQYEKLPNWLVAMDVGLNVYRAGPADYSSPLKLFDYMACGLALVSTDQPQVREIFAKLGQLDLVVSNVDAAPLAAALRKLAADRDRVKRQGLAGRQLVVDFYNWKRAVSDTLDAMKAIDGREHYSG